MARKRVAVGTTNEPAAIWVQTSTLLPWVKNPRKNDHVVDKVAESMARFGFGSPILARKQTGEVIAGHTRLKAALKLGLALVPVRYMELSEKDAHLLALADNKLNELSGWDQDMLSSIVQDFSEADMMLAGWDAQDFPSEAGADFKPGSEHEQGTLDSIKPITCPKCSHEFKL